MQNSDTLKRKIYTIKTVSVLIGAIAVAWAWYFKSIELAAQLFIGVVCIVIFVVLEYTKRLESMTCRECGTYGKARLIEKRQSLHELTPGKMRFTLSKKYQCKVCGNFWYLYEELGKGE